MPLREDWESAGNWLFRWRSYVPLVCLVLVVSGMRHLTRTGTDWTARWRAGHEQGWELFAFLVSIIGLCIRALAVGYVPSGTSGRNTRKQRASVLNVTGMYSIVRHPIYLGNFFIGFGFGLYGASCWVLTVFCLLFWIYYERIMYAEEEFLRRSFGGEYELWAARTPAFLPNLRLWRRPDRPFCLRKVLRKENSTYLGIVVVFVIADMADSLVVHGRFHVERFWLAMLLQALFVYVVLRVLKLMGALRGQSIPEPSELGHS